MLCATPSYALVIAQAVREAGIDPGDLALELGLFGGEPWTDEMRTELDRELGISAISFYGLSEMCGPGVAAECLEARDGLHVQEDHFLVEVVDPETGEPVARGRGRRARLHHPPKEAQPLIRYRTGDIGSVTTEPCSCGRTLARITALRGRLDDMLIVRGVNLFPSHRRDAAARRRGGRSPLPPDRRAPGEMDEVSVECEPADAEIDRAALSRAPRDSSSATTPESGSR